VNAIPKTDGGGSLPLALAASGPGAPGLSMPGTPGSHRGQFQTGTTTSGPLAASATPSAGDTPATPPVNWYFSECHYLFIYRAYGLP